ncbi:hypothetical protein PMZ80_005962 [Knufia obscura]|uniref:Uncharacterized protein n=2 Tax=Knufia TaxID=430999 RepID=A0AAN8EFV9_9EURO|nr:hypothetical protein PMZ80_005962 [Knufia obscura]KAK5954633.1 hypothetical protein OHC33_004355 [Knufia fluminis]
MPAFVGTLAAMVLVEACRRLHLESLLHNAIARLVPDSNAHHHTEDTTQGDHTSVVSVANMTGSSMLRGITGPPSVDSTPSCTLSEKLGRMN